MANTFISLSFFFFLIFIAHPALTAIRVIAVDIKKPRRFVTRLFHRDYMLPPHKRLQDATQVVGLVESSVARFSYLKNIRMERDFNMNEFEVDLVRSTFLFLVNFSIGTPPIPQLAVMDTGSSLLWIQCAPCVRCSKQRSPMLNPSNSSTYADLPCRHSLCFRAPRASCNSLDQCIYTQTYVNGVGSKGVLASERLTFNSPDRTTIVAGEVLFGCGHDNGNHRDNRFTGVLGLGNSPLSLAVQLGSKFSYCIGNINDPHYSYNQLVLGDDAEIEGDSTPLETSGVFYYLTLEWISIDQKRLDIDPGIFKRTNWRLSGIVIDSGTALTWLADDAYKPFRDEVKRLLDPILTRHWRGNDLCYDGKVDRDLVGFPAVTFHFAGDVDLVLENESMFYQYSTSPYPEVFCMAVRPSTENGMAHTNFSIIGLMAQQYYNVAYDLDRHKLYFQKIDCELLDDYTDPS